MHGLDQELYDAELACGGDYNRQSMYNRDSLYNRTSSSYNRDALYRNSTLNQNTSSNRGMSMTQTRTSYFGRNATYGSRASTTSRLPPPPPPPPVKRSVSSSSSSSSSSRSTESTEATVGSRYMSIVPPSMTRATTGRTAGSVLEPVETDHIHTLRLQQALTVGSSGAPRVPPERWLPIGAGKPFPPELPDAEDYIVEFMGPDDPLHPHNWSNKKKYTTTAILTYATFVASLGSAIFSPAVPFARAEFGMSRDVGNLGVSLYVLGFASGPALWAPLSELYGRRLPLVSGSFLCALFFVCTAVAKDIQTLMLGRFFAGFTAASQLAITPACFADTYNHETRTTPVAFFAMAVFVGPFASPFLGGFITTSYLGWRWTMYLSAIMGFFATALLFFFVDECYPPTILVEKAATLRRQTRNWGIHARQDEVELDFRTLLTTNFSRPIRMLAVEPILLLITLYMSFIYGLMYALLNAYPIVFVGLHGMSVGVGGLPFIALIIGEFLAGAFIIVGQISWRKKFRANHGRPVPEWRLPNVAIGGFVFTIGLFWFGWTGYTNTIHWMAPTAAGIAVGFGILCVFLDCFIYLIESYLPFSASVFAANTILRSAIGAGFPLFSTQMFNNLGVQWAATLLGCIAAVLVPVPLIFMAIGPKLRKKSPFMGRFNNPPPPPETDSSDEPDEKNVI